MKGAPETCAQQRFAERSGVGALGDLPGARAQIRPRTPLLVAVAFALDFVGIVFVMVLKP